MLRSAKFDADAVGVRSHDAGAAQSSLNSYFCSEARHWAEIYQRCGIQESIYHERLRAVLAIVDGLALPERSPALDIGCGAGFAAVALASRGLAVEALDPVEAMVQATRDRATSLGLLSGVCSRIGDIHSLPFSDGHFALVITLGVLPWLRALDAPLLEVARVLRPGGHLIVTVDCPWQLREALDPLRTPLLRWPKRWSHRLLELSGRAPKVRPRTISHRALHRALAAAGLKELGAVPLGFGPFTFFGWEVLPQALGLWLEVRLQSLANRGTPILRSCGSQLIVWARKGGPNGASSRASLT